MVRGRFFQVVQTACQVASWRNSIKINQIKYEIIFNSIEGNIFDIKNNIKKLYLIIMLTV